MEVLEQADRALFLFLNGLRHPALDPLMRILSAKTALIPFYLLLLWLCFKTVGLRKLPWILAGAALVILLADQGSVQIFKNTIQRVRPCHNTEIAHLVYTDGRCGGLYGFISSHAANTAGIAVFIGLILHRKFRYAWLILTAWVILVGYSRIYLGVHYPADLFAGWIFGAICGFLVYIGATKLIYR